MLIQHLKELESDGIVSRKDFRQVPPRVEYALTTFGDSLCEALAPLCDWGQKHMQRIADCQEKARSGQAREGRRLTRASSPD